MGTCVSCKKENAENTYRFAIVNVNSSSTTQNYVVARKTTTTIYEKLVSFERCNVCKSCIKKERVKYVLKWTALIAFGILCTLSVAGLRTGSFGLWIVIGTAIGLLISAVSVFIYSLFRKDVFFASDIRAHLASKGSGAKYRFVPVDPSLYCSKGQTTPELKLFKQRSGLRTGVADKLFENFVLPGNGDEQIDSLIDSQSQG